MTVSDDLMTAHNAAIDSLNDEQKQAMNRLIVATMLTTRHLIRTGQMNDDGEIPYTPDGFAHQALAMVIHMEANSGTHMESAIWSLPDPQ